MAQFDAVALAMILVPKGSKRVMGEFQAMRGVLRGASASTIQALVEYWKKTGMSGVVERRGVCLVVDRQVVARWSLSWLAAGGWTYDQLRRAVVGGRASAKTPAPTPTRVVAGPAKPVRRATATPSKPTLSKKELERRARADRKARNAERNAARRERQRKLAVEQAAAETQPEPASEEESQQIAVVSAPSTPNTEEKFTNDWIDSRYWEHRKRMPHRRARQRVWDKIFYSMEDSGCSHPECSREAQHAALRIDQVTQYQRAAQEAAA
jgi:hypothetical protein